MERAIYSIAMGITREFIAKIPRALGIEKKNAREKPSKHNKKLLFGYMRK